ncbi:hypothetical protein GW17_00012139 [Ensete ventricosum]|nr:hypothetical protein GW17_00012139 [Ensete ventricosum]
MGVFTFVCRRSGGEWSAKQLSGDLEGSAASTFTLQRQLVQAALAVDSSGGVQSSFSMVSPTSAVFQLKILLAMRFMRYYFDFKFVGSEESGYGGRVIIGGGGGGAFIGGGVPSGGAAAGGGAAAAPEAPPAEEKKEEKEESDDDMGFSLFD